MISSKTLQVASGNRLHQHGTDPRLKSEFDIKRKGKTCFCCIFAILPAPIAEILANDAIASGVLIGRPLIFCLMERRHNLAENV